MLRELFFEMLNSESLRVLCKTKKVTASINNLSLPYGSKKESMQVHGIPGPLEQYSVKFDITTPSVRSGCLKILLGGKIIAHPSISSKRARERETMELEKMKKTVILQSCCCFNKQSFLLSNQLHLSEDCTFKIG